MIIARKYVVTKHFNKKARKEDFKIVEEKLPAVKNGEILVKSEWISVDPYQRSVQECYQIPYVQFGFQIGTVIESMDSNFPVGTQVVSHEGWRDYYITNPKEKYNKRAERVYKLPELQGLPTSYALSAAGMVGATAYFGLLEILQPKPGETVVVASAAGATGNLVGQIAKIKGCKVIGIVGNEEKAQWLKELGFDKVINYKTANMEEALKEAAPEGVDCYFDGVGGEMSSVIMSFMNDMGRVGVCGWISAYSDDYSKLPKATLVQPSILRKRLTVKGFKVFQWINSWPEAFEQIVKWIKDGHIKVREHVTEGFDNLFEALDGMLAGENIGKALVKI